MNIEQRQMMHPGSTFWCHECVNMSRPGVLEWEVLQAARDGDVGKIQEYIDKEQDVNVLLEGECLLSRACAKGQVEIVKLLLQHPKIHLNIPFGMETPIVRAAQNGHMECFKLMLDSSAQCDVNLENCWKTLINVLKEQPELKPRSALRILHWAHQGGYWDVILLVLQSGHHFLQEDLYPLVLKAIHHNSWDVTFSVLRRDFYGKTELLIGVFVIGVRLRCWQRVKELAHMINGELKLEVPFVEVALTGNVDEVKRLLTKNQYDSHTLNATLLIVAAGGTSEEVAEYLLAIKDTYNKKTLLNALLMASLAQCTEIFFHLLSTSDALYSLSDLNQVKRALKVSSQFTGRGDSYLTTYLDKYFEKKLGSFIP